MWVIVPFKRCSSFGWVLFQRYSEKDQALGEQGISVSSSILSFTPRRGVWNTPFRQSVVDDVGAH